MAGSTFGKIFKVTTWGESHGSGVGVVVDGCPAGLNLDEEYIQKFLNRRKPGQSKYSTPRKEDDQVEILSGVFEGKTTGTPISLLVRNTSQRSHDYSEIKEYYRPGHADYTYDLKYGFRDYRGGGRSSGRETIGRVAAGAIACKLLEELDVQFYTYTKSIGPIQIQDFCWEDVLDNPLAMPDKKAALEAENYLQDCMKNHDSSGGIIECIIKNPPKALGDPAFEKLDANLAKAILSIGAVKGFEIGEGFKAASLKGNQNNDNYHMSEDNVVKETNHSGGILGGISDGSDIVFRVAIKPTPSIFTPQKTINKSGETIEIQIKGRHDPVIVPRAVVVVESMAALVLADALLVGMSAKLDSVLTIYQS